MISILLSLLIAAPEQTGVLEIPIPYEAGYNLRIQVWSYSSWSMVRDSSKWAFWTPYRTRLPAPGWYAYRILTREGRTVRSWSWTYLRPTPVWYDLQVSRIWTQPGDPIVGKAATLLVRVEGVSGRSPENSYLRLKVESGSTARHYAAPIRPMGYGDASHFYVAWPDPLQDQEYVVTATILAGGVDINPANDSRELRFRPMRESFDLAVENPGLLNVPQVGQTAIVRVTVRCLDGTSRFAQPQLVLYDLRPHDVYRHHSLTARKTQELARLPVPTMSRGESRDLLFTVTLSDQYYNLHAALDNHGGLDTKADNNLANSKDVRFRPYGGKDVVIRGCHVLYRRAHGITVSDEQIRKLKEAAQQYTEILWNYTHCIRLTFDTEIFDEAPGFSSVHDAAYLLLPDNIREDLKKRKIDINGEWFAGSDWRRYGLYVVQNPVPDKKAEIPRPNMSQGPTGGWGIWHKDGPNGGALYQWEYINFAQPNVDYFLHEGWHGFEANLGRNVGGWWEWKLLHKLPATHHYGNHLDSPADYSEVANQLQGGFGNAKKEYGDPYWIWGLETTPTEWWFDFTMGEKSKTHDSFGLLR